MLYIAIRRVYYAIITLNINVTLNIDIATNYVVTSFVHHHYTH